MMNLTELATLYILFRVRVGRKEQGSSGQLS